MKNFLKSPILALWLTVFIDLLGLGIVIPVLAALFFVPQSEFFMYSPQLFGLTISTSLLYGILLAVYPFAQFFGAPIIGDLSDRVGRKKMLLISISGTLVGYIITAIGIITNQIWLLFVGRLIDGFTGGNISVAQSAISDLSTPETKTRNFGLIGMAFGFGFIIGPYVGGKLADPTIVSWFNNSTPFIFAAILTLINVLLVIFNLKETLQSRLTSKFNLFGGFINLKKAFGLGQIRNILLVNFLFAFGFNFFTQFFQVYLISKFAFTQSQIGDIFAYIGLWVALTQGAFLRPLAKKYKPFQFINLSLLLLGVTFFVLLLPTKAFSIYLILPFIAIFNGFAQPNLLTSISNSADQKVQGEILGINQSIQSISQMIPPIIAGVISTISFRLPIIVAGSLTLFAWLIFKLTVDKNIKSQILKAE